MPLISSDKNPQYDSLLQLIFQVPLLSPGRQEEEIARQLRQETTLPHDLNYETIVGLSAEAKQKLSSIRPATMATRIPGMTPAAISLLVVHLKKRTG